MQIGTATPLSDIMMVEVYSLPVCPNCDDLKDKLHNHNISFATYDLEDDDVRMNLLLDSVTLVEAPIVKIDRQYMSGSDALKELGISE